MRGWVVALVGCAGDEGTDTGLPAGDSGAETGGDTGSPPAPCPWAGEWRALSHDCTASEALSWEATLGEDCVLVLTAQRYGDTGSPYPPLCSTTERIELHYDEPSATWRATSLQQSESLESCYAPPVGEYPLGVVGAGIVGGVLTLGFEPAPWSLSECASTEIVLTP